MYQSLVPDRRALANAALEIDPPDPAREGLSQFLDLEESPAWFDVVDYHHLITDISMNIKDFDDITHSCYSLKSRIEQQGLAL